MHLCFIDESGTPPKPSARQPRPYFVIAGIIMHEAQWHEVSKELRQLRAKPEFRVFGEIKWRFFGSENSDPQNAVRHLSQDAKDEFRRQFFNILIRRKSIKIISCVTRVESAYKQAYVKDEEDLYFFTYKPLSERFQYYLQDISKVVGDKQLGIIVADHRGKKQDDGLRSGHHRLVDDENSFTSKYGNLVETIFMTPSHLSIGVQFADMVAGAIGRAFNSDDPTYVDQLVPAFRTAPDGSIEGYGLVKFPAGWALNAAGRGQSPLVHSGAPPARIP